MTRIQFYLFVATALVLSGCHADVVAPDGGRYQEKQLTIQATYELAKTTTKTVLHDDGYVYWTKGDAISLFYGKGTGGGSKFTANIVEDSRIATFSGNVGAITGVAESSSDELMFWGLYPYDPAASCDGQTVTTTLKSEQVGMAGSFAPGFAPSLGRASGLLLSFRNLYSGLVFSVKRNDIKSLTLRSNAGEPLAGRAKFGMDAMIIPKLEEVVEGVDAVTVRAPEGGTFEAEKNYYLLLLPQTLSGGFTLELSTGDEKGVFTVTQAYTFHRNLISEAFHLDEYSSFSAESVTRSSFEDEHFANYVFANFDTDHDGNLSGAERDAVVTINLKSDTVASMQGIEFFPNLDTLSCSGTRKKNSQTGVYEIFGQLTSLDVSKNTELRYLTCSYNQLSSLDLSHNSKLERLYFYDNHLTTIDVSQNPSLWVLGASRNKLTALDVSDNAALEYLVLSDNQLTSLDVTHNKLLSYLNCKGNQLTKLNVSENPELTILYCHSNQISELDLSSNPLIYDLDCSTNQLTALDVKAQPALEYLWCKSNNITALDVSQNPLLADMECSSNLLTSLNVSKNTKLQSLKCSSNSLATLNVIYNPSLRILECNNDSMGSLYVVEGQSFSRLIKSDNTSLISLPNVYSVVGAFTSWSGDLEMVERAPGIWVSPAFNPLIDGQTDFKVRFGKQWDINFGGTFDEYGTPFIVVQDGPNIVTPADGKLVVTINVTDPCNVTVTVTKAGGDEVTEPVSGGGDPDVTWN